MTLIAAFRCPDGIVVCADSQETTWDGYRVTVQKIEPQTMGAFDVIMAGSGLGELLDSFVLRMTSRMENNPAQSVTAFKAIFEQESRDFRKDEVPLYHAPKLNKNLQFIVAVRSPERKYEAWITKSGRLCPITDFQLAGWDIPLYINEAKRMYFPLMGLSQAVLAGVQLLTVAENTSNYVKGPFTVAVVRDNAISIEGSEYIRSLQDRLRDYEKNINELFLACADTGVSPAQLKGHLSKFSASAQSLHKTHIAYEFDRMLASGINTVSDPYPKVPPGLTVAIAGGDMDEIYSSADKEKLLKRVKELGHGDKPDDSTK